MTSMSVKGRGRWLLPLSGMLLVMGVLLGLQYHTWRQNDPALWQRGPSGQVLRSYRTEIGQLQAKLTTYEREASEGRFSKVLNAELQRAKMGLGVVPVEGPGVVLELADPVRRPNLDVSDVVHDYDLVQVLNQLRASGAEAISLNGQRIVAESAVVCSGPLVQVNHETIPSPFVFTVIGDPKTLTSGMDIPRGLLDSLRTAGFPIKLTVHDKLQVPAIAVSPKMRFARAVPPTSDQGQKENTP